MTKAVSKPDPARFNLASFAELLPRRSAMVGEDPETFKGFRAGLLKSLAPATPYESVIAENLVEIEWELIQQRRMRQALLSRKNREVIVEAFVQASREAREHDAKKKKWDEDEALAAGQDLADRAVSGDPKVREQALAHISSLGMDPVEIMSLVYRTTGGINEFHNQEIKNLERRRNHVRREYTDLQKSRPDEEDIIDAEVVEPQPAKTKLARNWV